MKMKTKNPSRAELVAKALTLGVADEAAAKQLINTNKVSTFGKLAKVIDGTFTPRPKGKTKAKISKAKTKGKVVRAKTHASRKRRVAAADPSSRIDADTVKSVVRSSGVRIARDSTVHMPGVRGFRLGDRWIQSIKDGEGVAVRPANFPKLLATAQAKGVRIPKRKDLSPKELAATIAQAL